jgi:hypothetical protein
VAKCCVGEDEGEPARDIDWAGPPVIGPRDVWHDRTDEPLRSLGGGIGCNLSEK